MSLWEFVELEEQIGRYWHRLVGRADSYPYYHDAAITLDSVRASLGVFFRGLGGTAGVALAAGTPQSSGHRLRLRQRLGMEQESMPPIECNAERMLLPAVIAFFPSAILNRRLYFWLAAFFALAEDSPEEPSDDPLRTDLAFLHNAYWNCIKICDHYPGLAEDYQKLCTAFRKQRPARSRALSEQEQAVETVIQAILGKPCPDSSLGAVFFRAIMLPAADFKRWRAANNYRTFLPVPLWGKIHPHKAPLGEKPNAFEPDDTPSGQDSEDTHKKKSRREKFEQSERNDPLLLNRFEKLISWSEMVNVNRAVQDDDEDAAKDVAEAIEEITLSPHQRRVATKLKFDLDLAPDDVNPAVLISELAYPEWDYRRKDYLSRQCRVIFQNAEEENALWVPDLQARRRFRKIQRQFEALRPKREILHYQLDGIELDMDALVRAQCDYIANGNSSDQVYLKTHHQARDLAVAILVDVSLSTDSWVNRRRILDIEKEALVTLASGLATCQDAFAIYTFTSRKRHYVRIATVKDFNDIFNNQVLRRIAALRPGYYTRMGAALRHTRKLLEKRPERNRLILLLSDGKPNDLDYYEGRYGIEDTRQAILEARRAGFSVFGITIDRKAQDYFPYLFGRGGYAIVGQPDRLSDVLPKIYQQLVG
ncbi:nitric oxide reductase NorD protein [Nitrosomonas aestuarii]|uniref:Nitric oxide reductase NorD protein n=1 Tax=Nitrosomonas aestuarii TaxID=52441 RepID=A0A1I4F226_9PROT|nr:VWA domain-containing protein [Nitrosomonas aestuarii]SFL11370.1 nitric oxide reductase NorD protein [Nitrosomonas aestuarii]